MQRRFGSMRAGVRFDLNGMCTIALAIAFVACDLFASAVEGVSSEPIGDVELRFRREVMAVLSKGGCNSGPCHGNINGKGGFFLSLRGQDPEFDYRQIVYEASGRRVDGVSPGQSLLLLKAAANVAHAGGKRFDIDSPEYSILETWIDQGYRGPELIPPTPVDLMVTPDDHVIWDSDREIRFSVNVRFEDGSVEDVTRLAVYEPSDPRVVVTPDGRVLFKDPGTVTVLVRYLNQQRSVRLALRAPSEDHRWSAPEEFDSIDTIVFERLKALKINPSQPIGDAAFVRRVSLDLLGVLPTVEETQRFLADTGVDKRQRLVDQWLQRPEFASFWAQKWSDLLRNEEKTLDSKGVELFHQWILEAFASDMPLDEFAKALLVARGSTYEHPQANYWRAHREATIRAETTAQVFLGVRLQCARCHNHPFDVWTQDEYYQWASLFAGIEYEIVKNERKDDLDSHEFVGEQVVKIKPDQHVENPRIKEPAKPRLLGKEGDVQGDPLEQIALWINEDGQARFADAQVNRIWYHLMGVGLVEPVDDLRLTNPPSHPALLSELSREFIEGNFSVKKLVRRIVLSKTYQLSAERPAEDLTEIEDDPQLFAHARVRRLAAEQLLDAQSYVLDVPARFEGYPSGTKALEIAGVERVRRSLDQGDQFLRQFGKPARLLACECERSNEVTLGQALTLVGGESLHRSLKDPANRIGRLLQMGISNEEIVDRLFWTALTRAPSAAEREAAVRGMLDSGDPRQALEDLVWALLNAKEMVFRN